MIGHERTRRALEADLPHATLITGPASVGKRTLARYLAGYHGIGSFDLLDKTDSVLTVEQVRALRQFLSTAPWHQFRLALLHLDDASAQAQNALLKILEEPPGTARFLLTASKAPLPTIASRCQRHKLGYLGQQEVEQILIQLGLPAARAHKAAGLAGGQVKAALAQDRNTGEQKANVIAALRCIAVSDLDGFHRAFTTWDTEASMLLTVWLTEAITQRWVTFAPEDSFGLDRDRDYLLRMIAALAKVGNARPRLQTRAALEPFVGR